MKKLFLTVLFITLILCGCSYGEDVDSQAFVIAIGIDKGGDNEYSFTFVFANSSQNSESGKSGSDIEPDAVTVNAPTVFSAVKRLDAIKSKKTNLTHTKIVVFSDAVAKNGVGNFLSGFASSRSFRPNTYVCIAEKSARDYLLAVKPSQEKYIEKYYDHIMQKVVSDKVNEAYLYYLFFNICDKSSGSLVPLAGINKSPGKTATAYPSEDDFSYEARAGEITRIAQSDAEILGSAVLCNDKMVGTLGSFSTDLSRILCGEFYPQCYSIKYPGNSDFITVRIIQDNSPEIKSQIKNGNAVIDITVPLSIEYIDSGKYDTGGVSSDKFCDYIEKELDFHAEKLIYTAQEKFCCDFLGLGDSLKHHFPDMTSWEKFNWKEKFVSSDIDISFKIVFADFEETN